MSMRPILCVVMEAMIYLEGRAAVQSFQVVSAWSGDHARAYVRVRHVAHGAGLRPHVLFAARLIPYQRY